MNFKPSDKVVCISDVWIIYPSLVILTGHLPKKDKVYVVRGTTESGLGNVGLWLVGIVCNVHDQSGEEYSWSAKQFRKLEEIQAENKLKREQEEAAALKEATQLINSEP